MTNTYLTGNPLGSASPKDLYDNSSNIDEAINSPSPSFIDRFLKRRQTWAGMEMSFKTEQEAREADYQAWLVASGYEYLGEYAAGLIFTRRSQYMVRSGIAYRLLDSTAIPYTTTGNWTTEVSLFAAFSADAALRQDLILPSGSTLVGYKARTVNARLNDDVYLLDYGTGATAFVNSAATGRIVRAPGGAYDLGGTNLVLQGARFVFDAPVTFPNGKLLGAVIQQIETASNSLLFGGGTGDSTLNSAAQYKFGRTLGNHGASGLQIGGGEPGEGTDGTALYLDSYSGWAVVQNSKYPGPQELAVQPKPAANSANIVAGQDLVTAAVPLFSPEFVGKRIYLGDLIYLVSVYLSPTQVRVTNLNGSAVGFPYTRTVTCIICYVGGKGVCNVAGNTVTRVSGDPFVLKGAIEYKITLNGTTYDVTGVTDPDHLTIGATLGTLTGATYSWWTSVDNLTAALRVHRVAAAGFEENLTMSAHANGYFRVQALASGGVFPFRQYPLFIGSGYDSTGGQRANLTLDGTNGDTLIGGGYERFSLRVTHMDGALSNHLDVIGAVSGLPVVLQTEGVDANVDLKLYPKGSGLVWLGPSITGTVTPDNVIFVKNRLGQTFQIPCKLVP